MSDPRDWEGVIIVGGFFLTVIILILVSALGGRL